MSLRHRLQRCLVASAMGASTLILLPRAWAADGPFSSDSRFDQPVTLAVREQPVGDFLGELRKTHHLPVRADLSTHDERITVFCRERAAGEILAAVARHLDYTWVLRSKETEREYVLIQSKAQREREEQLRDDYRAATITALQKKAAERQAEGRRTPDERRRLAIERLHQRAAQVQDPKTRQGIEETIQDLLQGNIPRRMHPNAGRDAFDAALAAMRPGDWDRLWEGHPYRFAYSPQPGRASLAEPQAAAIVRTAVEDLTETTDEEGLVLSRGTFAGIERVRGELVLDLEAREPALALHCRYLARQPGARVRSDINWTEQAWSPWEPALVEAVVDPEDRDLQRLVDVPPPAVPFADPEDESPWLSDVLEALRPCLPYTLIADAYDDDGEGRPLPRGRRRLDEWLNEVGEHLKMRVHRAEGTLCFRHREWFRLRRREVPARRMRPWEARLRRDHAFALASLCQMASAFSSADLWNLIHWWQHRPPAPEGDVNLLSWSVGFSREALRLLASLTPAERQLLSSPGHPPVPLLRPAQAAVLLEWHPWYDPVARDLQWEGPGRAPPARPLEAIMEDELRLEEGRTEQFCLRLRAEPGVFYVGRRNFAVPNQDAAKALAVEREARPEATLADLRVLRGTRWEIALYPDPVAPEPIDTFEVFSSDQLRGTGARR
jgi:hypothetical protein